MFNFEDLHSSHKTAFLDGLLSGIAIAYFANRIYKDYQEDAEFRKLLKEEKKNPKSNQ